MQIFICIKHYEKSTSKNYLANWKVPTPFTISNIIKTWGLWQIGMEPFNLSTLNLNWNSFESIQKQKLDVEFKRFLLKLRNSCSILSSISSTARQSGITTCNKALYLCHFSLQDSTWYFYFCFLFNFCWSQNVRKYMCKYIYTYAIGAR